MRDHGGNLDEAMATYGGTAADWLDLSTGINRVPYPLPPISASAWTDLPRISALDALRDAARQRYRSPVSVLPLAGAQTAIQMLPYLTAPGTAHVLGPTYNEHAACLRGAGWSVTEVRRIEDLRGADLAVIVNPNNPDGHMARPEDLGRLAANCGRLIVDESFADPHPACSIAPYLDDLPNVLVQRSFGKFYGLAGLRLGFLLGQAEPVLLAAAMAGPWPVSGPALEIGRQALLDETWTAATCARLAADAARLDGVAEAARWTLVGGTHLFRLYDTGDARAAQSRLAIHRIWSRIFPWSDTFMRLGLPGSEAEWHRLERALA